MIRKNIFTFLAIFGLIALHSCEKEVSEREADELLRLEAYMSIHYPDLEPTESGLYYIIIEQGEGDFPAKDDYLLFDFTGRNLDDMVFETTDKSTAYIHDLYTKTKRYAPKYLKYQDEARPMIKGMEEGLSYLREGGKARFIMPSKLAYGSNQYNGLYAYSSVIFDVELKKIVSDPVAYETEQINNYITENYPDLVIEDILFDGIYILENTPNEIEEGDEEVPEPILDEDVVEVDYTGRLIDNWIFDTSIKTVAEENDIYVSNKNYIPLEVTIGGTGFIEGFSLALKNLTTKHTAKVIIPSEFAYGELGNDGIPAYAPLIFDLIILGKTSPDDGAEE